MKYARTRSCDNENVPPTPDQQARAAAIAAEITALTTAGFALPGTLADRMTRCGHPGCRCHADPPQLHGPYHQWTRKKNGRTATRIRHRRGRPPLEPLASPPGTGTSVTPRQPPPEPEQHPPESVG